MLIELKNVSYIYSKNTPFKRCGLNNVDFCIREGEWVGIMGTTGSGKSTLLQHLNGLLKPDTGEVLLDGINIHSSAGNLRKARRDIGLVFQYPEHQLFGTTVFEEISYGPENFGFCRDEIEVTVKKAMEVVGLDFELFKNRSPHQLSGGEKRRVALASVLAVAPRVIVFDEPTAGLDHEGKRMLVETVVKLNKDYGITVVWVTHDSNEIVSAADRLVVLDGGRIALDGPIRDIIMHPLLRELGLEVPLAVQVADLLRDRGLSVDGAPMTVEELKREIIKVTR